MPLMTVDRQHGWRNNLSLVISLLATFASLDVIAHRNAPYFLTKLACAIGIAAGSLLLSHDRDTFDTYAAVMSAIFAMFALAMTTGDSSHPSWWPRFLLFIVLSLVFVLATRKRRATLVAIGAIVGFRLLVFLVLFVAHVGHIIA